MPILALPASHIQLPPGRTARRLASRIRHSPGSSSCASQACRPYRHRRLRYPCPRRPSPHPLLPSCAYMSPERVVACPRHQRPCDPRVVAYERAQLRVAAANDVWTSLAQQVEVEGGVLSAPTGVISSAPMGVISSAPLLDWYRHTWQLAQGEKLE